MTEDLSATRKKGDAGHKHQKVITSGEERILAGSRHDQLEVVKLALEKEREERGQKAGPV